LEFVETFVRCEGKIKRVEQEVGLSYPAVRARLTEVIRAMGYDIGEQEQEPISDEAQRAILSELSAGKITAEEALNLLRRGE